MVMGVDGENPTPVCMLLKYLKWASMPGWKNSFCYGSRVDNPMRTLSCGHICLFTLFFPSLGHINLIFSFLFSSIAIYLSFYKLDN